MNLKEHPKLKHPFKSLISEREVPLALIEHLKSLPETTGPSISLKQAMKTHPNPLVISSDGKAYGYTPLKVNGKTYYLAEPDPIVLNYNIAYEIWKSLRSSKPKQFEKLADQVPLEDTRSLLYGYFGRAMTFTTSLFTAVEASLNRAIPKDYVNIKADTRNTVSRNKQQLMEFITFKDKLTILKEAIGKSYTTDHPLIYHRILKLKELRDLTIHPKDGDDDLAKYPDLYKQLFKIDFPETLLAVKSFVNYHAGSEIIRDCTCGKTEND